MNNKEAQLCNDNLSLGFILFDDAFYEKFINSFPYLKDNIPDANSFDNKILLIGDDEDKIVPIIINIFGSDKQVDIQSSDLLFYFIKSESEEDVNIFLDYHDKIKESVSDLTSVVICDSYLKEDESIVNEIGNYCNDNDINFFNINSDEILKSTTEKIYELLTSFISSEDNMKKEEENEISDDNDSSDYELNNRKNDKEKDDNDKVEEELKNEQNDKKSQENEENQSLIEDIEVSENEEEEEMEKKNEEAELEEKKNREDESDDDDDSYKEMEENENKQKYKEIKIENESEEDNEEEEEEEEKVIEIKNKLTESETDEDYEEDYEEEEKIKKFKNNKELEKNEKELEKEENVLEINSDINIMKEVHSDGYDSNENEQESDINHLEYDDSDEINLVQKKINELIINNKVLPNGQNQSVNNENKYISPIKKNNKNNKSCDSSFDTPSSILSVSPNKVKASTPKFNNNNRSRINKNEYNDDEYEDSMVKSSPVVIHHSTISLYKTTPKSTINNKYQIHHHDCNSRPSTKQYNLLSFNVKCNSKDDDDNPWIEPGPIHYINPETMQEIPSPKKNNYKPESSNKVFKYPVFKIQKNRGELIIKLEIDIPQTHKVGIVEIYENDKPTILANQFMRKYKINNEFYDSILESITQQQKKYKLKLDRERQKKNIEKHSRWLNKNNTKQMPFKLKSLERHENYKKTHKTVTLYHISDIYVELEHKTFNLPVYLNKTVEDHINLYINKYGLSYRFIPQLTEKVKEAIELYRENQKLKFYNNRKRFIEEDMERVQDYYSSDITRRSSCTSSVSQIDPIRGRVIQRLLIPISDDIEKELLLYENDEVEDVVKEFVKEYDLPDESIEQILSQIPR